MRLIKALLLSIIVIVQLNGLFSQSSYSNVSTIDSLFIKNLYKTADSLSEISSKKALVILDSIDKFIIQFPFDEIQWKSYVIRGNVLFHVDEYELSLLSYEKSLVVLDRVNDKNGLTTVLACQAAVYSYTGEKNHAIKQYNKILKNCQDTTEFDIRTSAFANYSLAEIFRLRKEPIAVKHYLKSDSLAKKIGYKTLQGGVNYGLGLLYKNNRNNETACQYFSKAEIYWENNFNLPLVYTAWSNALIELKNLSAAKTILNKALEIQDLSIRNRAFLLNTYGTLLRNEGTFRKAEIILKQAKELTEGKLSLRKKHSEILGNLGKTYLDMKNYGLALSSLTNAKKIMFNDSSTSLSNKTYMLESIIEAKLKQNKQFSTSQLMEEFIIFSDSLRHEHDENIMQDLLEKYKSEKKQAENDNLIAQQKLEKTKLKTQKLLTTLGGIGILLLSSFLFIIFRQKKKQKDLNKTLADRNIKISLISKEIAHRAKNQLALATNLISNQKYKAQDLGAKQLIEESENKLKALSAVNRRLSDDDELSRVSLKEVIEEVVSNNIYSLSSIDIKYDLSLPDSKIDSSKMSLIALIINELSTNSIKHAFEGKTDPKIYVKASIDNNKFSMKYRDNGNVTHHGNSKGTGQNLIGGLVSQLQGIYKIDVTSGFIFDLNFPL